MKGQTMKRHAAQTRIPEKSRKIYWQIWIEFLAIQFYLSVKVQMRTHPRKMKMSIALFLFSLFLWLFCGAGMSA